MRCLAARCPPAGDRGHAEFFIRRLAAAAVARASSRHSHIPSDPSFHGWGLAECLLVGLPCLLTGKIKLARHPEQLRPHRPKLAREIFLARRSPRPALRLCRAAQRHLVRRDGRGCAQNPQRVKLIRMRDARGWRATRCRYPQPRPSGGLADIYARPVMACQPGPVSSSPYGDQRAVG